MTMFLHDRVIEMSEVDVLVELNETEEEIVEEAAERGRYTGVDQFVREGVLRLADEVLDIEGHLECPVDDCDATFTTERQLNGHLGSFDHARNVEEGEFWCGVCGFGPGSQNSIGVHHGQCHDGDVIYLDEEPDEDDLEKPDDLPDHRNALLLERLYEEHDGNYTAMCREHDFEVCDGRVREYLIKFDIHDPTPQGTSGDGVPKYRDPEWLEEKYEEADGNISEMHRQEDLDIAYKTLVNRLKKHGIHKPERRGRDQSGGTDETGDDSGESTPPVKNESEDDSEVEDETAEFGDLDTPDWLDEASFYAAADMSTTIDELAETLGWQEQDRLEEIVQALDIDSIDME